MSAPPRKESPSPARSAFDRVLAALRSGDRPALAAALEELRAACTPPPIPDPVNAALLYQKAFDAFPDGLTDEDLDLSSRLSQGYAITAGERAQLQDILDRNPEALRLLHEAADRPGCNFNTDTRQGLKTELGYIVGLIRCSRLLSLEALLQEGPGVSPAVRAASRLAEAAANEPFIVSRLVSGVTQVLASDARQREFEGDLPPERLTSLVSSLPPERVRSGLEKALLLDLYATVKAVMDGMDIEHTLQGLGPEHILPPGAPGTPRLDDPTVALDLENLAQMLSQYAAVAERPYYEAKDELARLETLRETTPEVFSITRMCLPSLARTSINMARTEAVLGTAQVAAALRLYRDTQTEYPATLDLLRTILPAPPVDPFTGKAYLYRREGSGFVVYSAGPDGAPSGGIAGGDDIQFRSPR